MDSGHSNSGGWNLDCAVARRVADCRTCHGSGRGSGEWGECPSCDGIGGWIHPYSTSVDYALTLPLRDIVMRQRRNLSKQVEWVVTVSVYDGDDLLGAVDGVAESLAVAICYAFLYSTAKGAR